MTSPSRKITATLLAAAGLSSLSPMQQGAALLTAAGAALWASPALATNNIPGVGTIVKKNPGPGCLMSPGKDSSAEPSRTGCVIAPSDANGETRLTGLEPGTYSVRLVEGAEETMMKVGDDGKLAFVAYEDIKTAEPQRRKVQTKQLKAYRNGEQPVARRWAEQIAFDGNCDEPGKCPPWGNPRLALDLNSANADQLMRGTSNSPDTAKVIIADREMVRSRASKTSPSGCARLPTSISARPQSGWATLSSFLPRVLATKAGFPASNAPAPMKAGSTFSARNTTTSAT
jgi:hypothetical protein